VFDAHTHLDFPEFDADRTEVLRRSRGAGVTGWIIAGTEPRHWHRTARVAREIGALYCLGVHPWRVAEASPETEEELFSELSQLTPDGVGETGLDFATARDPASRNLQARWFRAHLRYARERSLPVVIHAVRCYPELLQLLRTEGTACGGMIHSWSGPPELIDDFVSIGFSISFSQRAILVGSVKTINSLTRAPMERLLLETDCPTYAHGVRTEPAHLLPALLRVAEIKSVTREALATQLTANVRRLWPSLRPPHSTPT
jgi:TatD DNase family protein